ncbi:uncharacterized protein TNIN_261891 [Trichonephila inaurata madagascariensis]|uniref:Mutator-like transposase domain-containing protein n=1 Tax=Trichonephila inaurata madagascariensis TaxID=2747483 RepID=A0A8X7BU54_9ARAC|nr:uncharacterized protein TNIN_261891 [Trichonephila inaurata madagascariensis]
MRCIGQGLESLKTFCAVMSLPNPVEQKSYDVINNKLSLFMKEVAKESMKRAAVEENSSSTDNLLTVSGDGTWKTRGHSSLIGVCTVIGSETEKFGLKINKNVCVSLPERDNRRIFTSRKRSLASSFETRRAKKIKRLKKLSCLSNRKAYFMILEHFSM